MEIKINYCHDCHWVYLSGWYKCDKCDYYSLFNEHQLGECENCGAQNKKFLEECELFHKKYYKIMIEIENKYLYDKEVLERKVIKEIEEEIKKYDKTNE